MPYYVESNILAIFLQVLNMSLTGSVVLVFVLAARLILKRAPKIFSYALWSVVFFRLLCPISFTSTFSLLPIHETSISKNTIYSATPRITTGIGVIDNAVNPILPAPSNGDSVNPLQIAAAVGQILWLVGILALLIYSVVSFLRLRKKLIGSVRLHDNIFLADHIVSPFVIGLFKPKIYLPSSLSEQERGYIILHEQCHIRRLDHLVKIIAFAALCIHWFNPLTWVAFILIGKDMETACDECVMKRFGADIREEYSASLLSLATGRKIIAGTPLAFCEGNTKNRIKNVLRYKKPAVWVMLASLIAVFLVCTAFASNPQRTSMQWAKNLRVEDVEKIELTAWNYAANEQYRRFTPEEFPEIVALVRDSRGGYLPNPEPVVGGGVVFYLTLKDGTRHFVSNGNGDLNIDGDHYAAGQDWLHSWKYKKGNALLPPTFYFGDGELLTLDKLKIIAEKGDGISWEDFAAYEGQDVGFGLYIMNYPMAEPYYVRVGGVPNQAPMYVLLCSTDTEQSIDIRQESIEDYLKASKTESSRP